MLQIVRLGPSENITAGASPAQSSVAPAGTTCVRVVAVDGDVRIRLHANDAGAASTFLPQGAPEYFLIGPGSRISAVRAGSTDVSVNVTFCSR
jgi:hypothetical protein